MANEHTQNGLMQRYAAIVEQPNFKMSELICAMEADYRNPDRRLSTKDLIHLGIKVGMLLKLQDPKL